ncbi:MAG TPA: type II toxin-antitoxin system death-on-curing family toxin [Phenylobacterium sp.]
MTVEPVWLDKPLLLALYDDVVVASGGASGLRDEGLLESALARPINRRAYEGVEDLLELAATYAVGIASNHPFLDGNKRMAFMALGQFLEDNGVVLTADTDDATTVMLSVATGATDIAALTEWLRNRTLRIGRAP